jgi:predicted O-methyltransferase YrrM
MRWWSSTRPSVDEKLELWLRLSEAIPGWTRNEEARELLRVSYSLSAGAVIVEIGSFLGAGAILLAGPRRICGSGVVYCVDPFDGTGDSFSVPHYRRILEEVGGGSLRDHFEMNIRNAGLDGWVRIQQGRAKEVARAWTKPIDLLYLDGDQSRKGVRETYDSWVEFLKVGGIIAVHNSEPGDHAPDHDGHRCIVQEEIKSPYYRDIRLVGSTTFAMRSQPTD